MLGDVGLGWGKVASVLVFTRVILWWFLGVSNFDRFWLQQCHGLHMDVDLIQMTKGTDVSPRRKYLQVHAHMWPHFRYTSILQKNKQKPQVKETTMTKFWSFSLFLHLIGCIQDCIHWVHPFKRWRSNSWPRARWKLQISGHVCVRLGAPLGHRLGQEDLLMKGLGLVKSGEWGQ